MQISTGLFKLRICKEFKFKTNMQENFYKTNIKLDQVFSKASFIDLQDLFLIYQFTQSKEVDIYIQVSKKAK